MQTENVRMLQPGGELDFALESLSANGCREVRMQKFYCDAAIVPYVDGQVHRGHAATPELLLDRVPVCNAGLQAF